MSKKKDIVNIFEVYADMALPDDHKVAKHLHSGHECSHEGEKNIDMAKSEIFNIIKSANSLLDLLSRSEKMEPWMLSKLVKASDYVSSVKNVMEYDDFENSCGCSQEDINDIDDGVTVVSKIKDMLSSENMFVNEEVLRQIIFNIECLRCG